MSSYPALQIAAVALLLVGLFLLAVRRPWTGLVVLLALVPFNGLILDVMADWFQLSSDARTALAGWHDSLALGIVVASLFAFLRTRGSRLGSVELLIGAVLAYGLVAVLVSPHAVTALYAYRTLYEPVALCAAVLILARTSGLPDVAASRAPLAIVSSGVLAAAFAWWQVYVGGAGYLNAYFRTPDGRLPAAYFASMISQPRAFATFHSPNEFGAYLVLAIALTVVSGILPLSARTRMWILVPLGLGLLLTFSRSAWIGATVAIAVTVVMSPRLSVDPRRWAKAFGRPGLARLYGPPIITGVLLTALVAGTSGAPAFVSATLLGRDPSSASRVVTVSGVIEELLGERPSPSPGASAAPPLSSSQLRARVDLFGMGLGMAGPKSARFGEIGALDIISSETWYVNYVLQVGIVGGLLFLVLIADIARRLWRDRRRPWSVAAMGAGAGLAVGALAIPVVDEPAVAIPLWSVLGFALALADHREPMFDQVRGLRNGRSAALGADCLP